MEDAYFLSGHYYYYYYYYYYYDDADFLINLYDFYTRCTDVLSSWPSIEGLHIWYLKLGELSTTFNSWWLHNNTKMRFVLSCVLYQSTTSDMIAEWAETWIGKSVQWNMFLHRLWFQSIFTAIYNDLQLTVGQILTPFSHSIGLLQVIGKHLFRSSESFLQSCVPLNCSQTVLQIPIHSLIFNLLPLHDFESLSVPNTLNSQVFCCTCL